MSHVNRRRFLTALGAAIASPRPGLAQSKIPTLGLLWNDSVKPSPIKLTLMEALRQKGYVDGRNIQVLDRISLTGYGPMAESAAELARAKTQVIFTYGTTATLAAAKATAEVPIVMVSGVDPVRAALAQSIGHPGKNVTGVSTLVESVQAKRVQLLTELIPGVRRIGLLFAPEASAANAYRHETENAAQLLGLTTHVAEIRKVEDLEGAFASLSGSHVQAAVLVPSSFLNSLATRITALAARHRIPIIYSATRFVEAGGLLTYVADLRTAVTRAADYVDRILRGALPGDLPIEQLEKLELVVNMKAAKALGIGIPQSILVRADRVIE